MTLTCLAALFGLSAAPEGPAEPGRSEAGLSVYSNDDNLTVVSPWAKVRGPVTESVVVGGSWNADAISAASIDIVTQATPSYEEERHEGRLDASVDLDLVRVGADYTLSVERDTRTQMGSVSGETDFFQRNLTLGMAYALGLDRLGRWDEPEDLWHDRTTHRVGVSATQVLGRSSVGSVDYTFQYMTGFLQSPYRMVPILPPDEELQVRSGAQWVNEQHPDSRGRHALTFRGRHALTRRLFVNGEYRGYLDTWSMRSNTAELGGSVDIGGDIDIVASDRYYWQSSASFYRPVYTVNREIITRDRRLSKLMSNIAGLGLRHRGSWLELLLRGEYHWERYDDFRVMNESGYVPMPDTQALVVQVGFAVEM